jgi:hypothetical protein
MTFSASRAGGREALERLGDTVGDVLVATGVSQDDLVDEVAPNRGRRRRR